MRAIGDRIAFKPPLVITEEQIGEMGGRFGLAFDDAEKDLGVQQAVEIGLSETPASNIVASRVATTQASGGGCDIRFICFVYFVYFVCPP